MFALMMQSDWFLFTLALCGDAILYCDNFMIIVPSKLEVVCYYNI